MQAFALSLYSLLTWVLQPLIRLRLKRRAVKEPMYGQWVPERFGEYSQQPSSGWLWIHAVSLGETRAASILLRELRSQIPDLKLLLTHGTATGREEGTKLLLAGDVQVWQPWDSAAATQKFIAHFRPSIGIVMETEVWPNLCAAAAKHGVPMILANARLNENSQRKALRLSWLARRAYGSFTQVLAQTRDDAERLRTVGAREVRVMGNVKYDVEPQADLMRQGGQFKASASGKHVILLASSREGEDALFLEQIRQLAAVNTALSATKSIVSVASEDIQWMIVPRHPQRFDEVQRLIEQAGLSVSRRSSWRDTPHEADVWLGDTMGEMPLYYALADIALLGGSFESLGGQNLIESIAAGCPVVMGPHTFNFADACNTAQEQGAALRSGDMAGAVALAVKAVQNSDEMQKLKHRGEDWLYFSRGAARQMVMAMEIAQLLDP